MGPRLQFIAFARILAMVVLPVPLGPENKIAWATLPDIIALDKVWVTCSCFTTSLNICGRYLRASTRYDIKLFPEYQLKTVWLRDLNTEIKTWEGFSYCYMAEREGFEPSVPL